MWGMRNLRGLGTLVIEEVAALSSRESVSSANATISAAQHVH